MELKNIIYKVNSFILGICNYFSISAAARKQFNYLDDVIYRRLHKILKQKYKSKPGMGIFIKNILMKDGRVFCDNIQTLKVSDIKPYGGANIN